MERDQENRQNLLKHKITFEEAVNVFRDPKRLILIDTKHSSIAETRYLAIGKIELKICTVRFTIRNNNIRIIGAGFWRKESRHYEKRQNTSQVQRSQR